MTDPAPAVPTDLFDRRLRALRRDRAARLGPELFLHERAFAECLDRLDDVKRSFDRALLVGVPDPAWVARLEARAATVDSLDPGALFAAAAHGVQAEEDRFGYGTARFDLVVAVGTLDTVNQLGPALAAIRRALRPDGLLIGALAGGGTLPALRRAMLAADRLTGPVAMRTHPRIEPSALAALLGAAGFVIPVVDVDRVILRYASLSGLVRDLRAMGGSNMLAERAPPRGRRWAELAAAAFAAEAVDGRTAERVDLLHFLGWTPPL
ncbi:MAG: class I SAM-dependent methyltransferase [Pseudomonadota bacterium]|nr:class I SAM-dependent methyltransferase [Pseudomonadota bacterium]